MPEPKERSAISVRAERTVLAAVRLPDSHYNHEDPFGELTSLAEQAGAVVVGQIDQMRDRPRAGTYIGIGKAEELAELCQTLDAHTIIFDHELSPRQIANIEKITSCKVLDRSELILDIFASRASSHEAKLQVEIAQLEYTYPRLRAMWDHLERIVGSGGIGGVGTRGPGEQQIEIDRRLVQKRKKELNANLLTIQKRKARAVAKRKIDNYTVGLVGYTNAGKSTLFNTLTQGGAYADDRLFATLISRTRQWDLGGGTTVMLSDTVGFVRDLPHNLIASFKATLEEATHADLLLIVLDISDPAAEMHYKTVTKTLDELIAPAADPDSPTQPPLRLLLLNKADSLPDNRQLLMWQQKYPYAIPLCALPDDTGLPRLGAEDLINRVLQRMQGKQVELLITIPLNDARTIHMIENRSTVLDRIYQSDRVELHTRISQRLLTQLRSSGAKMTLQNPADRTDLTLQQAFNLQQD